MKTLKWTSSLCIDNGPLDYEHKIAIFIVNRFIEMGRQFKTLDQAMEFLEILLLHSRNHFAHEEHFMQAIGYPLLEQHRHKHGAMLKGMCEMVAKLQSAGSTELPRTAREMGAFLKYWLTRHILIDDMDIKAFLREKDTPETVSYVQKYALVG